VTHGYAPGEDGPIWITLASRAGAIDVAYEDAGRAFNPLADRPASREESRPLGTAPGGMGLALVRGLSVAACYTRVGSRNRITLTVPIADPPPLPPPTTSRRP
jgi:anti-sigma regulatory factor (Ser/Thr protein kinase)